MMKRNMLTKVSTNFWNTKILRYPRYTSNRAVFVEQFNRAKRVFIEETRICKRYC